LNEVHRGVLRASGGHVGGTLFGMTVIELHTVGRRSGREHSTLLTVPVLESGRLVLVSSKVGDDRDPDWYRNILAHPEVDFTVARERKAAIARPATPEEASDLWPLVLLAYRPYGSYQRRSSRDIPLIICEPR
jgi:deazaflavin-dependent oxidoreductase (nitroreductase family)